MCKIMLNLNYKTRGNSSPQGKPKVFFCCLNEDFVEYFQKLSDEVLELQNCSVWYAKNYDVSLSEEDRFGLSTMNLFLVPVTMNFLTQDQGYADRMIQLSIQNHIPVLPIMTETGIERLFERKFGNMQFLVDDPSDVTAIPYKEKLNNFLSKVFWGDELSEKIRDAFDAYVFLSYRKKDRLYAQKLMHLIHESESCRDIAIWYDEFLVPGENFSQSIVDALEKSDIFTLVVTPNLINEENYVLSTEYPMACDKHKPILPVEMESTDPERLAALYSGIPSAVNSEDKDKIYRCIKDIIPDIISAKQNKDARHSFFMGLAYLSGIDVEVDRGRAISLIETAADDGLDDALEKLVSMYSYGDGVSQSYDDAIKWKGKLVDKYADISEETMKEENIIVFLRHIDDLGNLAYNAGDYEKTREKYETMYNASKLMAFGAVGKNIFSKVGNIIKKYSGHSKYYMESYFYFLKSIRMLLFICDDIGDGVGRDEMVKKAMVVGNASAQIYDDERIVRECCLLFGRLGILCLESGNIQGADYWFQKENETYSYIESENNSAQNRMHEVSVLCHCANIREFEGDYAGTISFYKEATKKLESSYEEFKDSRFLLETVKLLIKEGEIYLKTGERVNCRDAFEKAKDIIDNPQFSELPSFQTEKAILMMNFGDYYHNENLNEDAKMCYEYAVKSLTNDIDEKLGADDLRNAALACVKYGDFLFDEHKFEDSMQYYKEGEEYYVNVAMFSKSVHDTRLYITCLIRLYDNAVAVEDFAKAAEWIDKAHTFSSVVAQSTGLESDIRIQNDISNKRQENDKRIILSEKNEGVHHEKNSMTLEVYVEKKHEEICGMDQNEIQKHLEAQIGDLCMYFWKTHTLFGKRDKVAELGGILLNKKSYVGDIKEKDLPGRKWYLTGKVTDILLEASNTLLKYDEDAMLILSFCGYYDLKYAKHVKGGREEALRDYYKFYKKRPFWKYSINDLRHPDLWAYLSAWISEINME